VDVVATEGATAGWDDNGLPSIGFTQSGEYSAFAGTPGCSAVPQTLEVNLLPVPQTDVVATPETLCWEESGALQLNVSAGALVDSIAWPDGTNSLTQAGPGGYEFFMVGDNGCEKSETFAYPMLPPIVSGLVDPRPLCDDSIATLSITGNVDNIAWNTGGSGADLTVFPSMGGGPFVANVTLGACSRSDTAHVTWWPTPSVGTLQDSVSRCVLGPGYSFAWPDQSEPALGTWIWTVNDEPATAGYNAFEEGLYTIEVSDNVTGCFDTHETVLNVLPNLALDIDVDDPLICMGDSTSVEVTILSVLDTDPYEIPFSLEWSTEGMSGLTNNAAGGQHFVVATNACGSVEVMAEVEEEYCGCNLWIPNTFTPDGDGLNEGFQIVSSCQWDAFSFRVFNRWGEQVWSTFDQDRPWDGGADDLGEGKHYLPDGVYTYVVRWEYRDRGVFFKDQRAGHILLVR
jgi:gliding motility-associated-like protein